MTERKKKHYKLVKEADFKQVKSMLEANVSSGIISQVTGRAYGTIKMMDESKNYEDYKARLKEGYKKWPKAKKEVPAEQTIVSILGEINVSMKELVKAWKEPRKKSIFG